jgi:hypothetical protein
MAMFPENSLRQDTERKSYLANERGPHQPLPDEQMPATSVLDIDDDFCPDDLYLDIGVGD